MWVIIFEYVLIAPAHAFTFEGKGKDMSTSSIAILTDSTCDIPQDLVESYEIDIIPTTVIWGEDTYRDRIDLSPRDFYARLEKDPIHPKTTQPGPTTFETHYREALQAGAQEIIVFTVSSALSGTYNVARQAASTFDIPIRVVDSKGPTMSLGWQVLAAARAREAGKGRQGILDAATMVRQNVVLVVLLDTLEYIHKGGRIGGAAKFVGSLLNLKPLVEIDHQQGTVEAAGRARTFKRGIAMLKKRFFSQLDTARPLRIAVLHGDAEKEAQQLAQDIQASYDVRELLFNITGPVLGVNTGPGAIALCGYPDGS